MPEDANRKKHLGDFEIVRELGRGGMGIVYEARQVSLNRKVALKVISGSLGLSSKAVLRFQREAEAAGKLHHTNIVPIYSTGNDDGAHYYAMELIEGPSLHQVIRSLRSEDRKSPKVSGSAATMAVASVPAVATNDSVLDSSRGAVETRAWVSEILGSPPVSAESTPAPRSSAGASSTSAPSSSSYFDTVATMIAGVAEALDYAHENGVIHRDIKPANLMLSKDGRLSINDFGLARMLEQPGMTMSGEFVGSPLYMSPEQITAGRAPLDHRTDIYSLGATLYELLALEPAFPGRSRDEVIAQIIHKEPAPPRRHNPKVPVDLETICLKAMEKDPDRRYQAAGQLAEDLWRFVNRHAISARRIGPVERAVRWARRNKALTAMACSTLVVCVAASTFLYRAWLEKREILQDKAVNDMLHAAMSGDLETALLAIENAEDLVDPAWQLMLLGQVDMFDGRSKDALSKLRKAVDEDPHSIMARSMLANAFMANGLWDGYVKQIDEIERLTSEEEPSAEDLLFKGQALSWVAPQKSLDTIELAIKKRPTFTLARVLRANSMTIVAQSYGDKDKLDAAIGEFKTLGQYSRQLENSPLLNAARLRARLSAFRLCLREGDTRQAEEYLREAKKDVEILETFPRFQQGNWMRLHYYEFKEESEMSGGANLDELETVMREVTAGQGTGFIVGPYCSTVFGLGKGRVTKALETIEHLRDLRDDPFMVWSRVVLLSATSEGRKSATAFLERYLEGYGRDSEAIEDVIAMLYVRGQVDAAYVKERVEHLGNSKYLQISRASLRYLIDELTERQLVDRYGDSEDRRAHTHFMIGLRKLTEGDRKVAREHFQKSGNSTVFQNSMSTWSRAFLSRMNDETWPEWLPTDPIDSAKEDS